MVALNIMIEYQNCMGYLKTCISSISKIGLIRSSIPIALGERVVDLRALLLYFYSICSIFMFVYVHVYVYY